MKMPVSTVFIAWALLCIPMALHAGSPTGCNYKKADSISVGKSKSIKLVNEVDVDDGEAMDSGAYYLKFTAKRDQPYTVYTSGIKEDDNINVDIGDISYYDYDKEVYWPGIYVGMDSDSLNFRGILTVEDWDDEDWDDKYDKSVTVYIYVSGEVGASLTVTVVNAEVEEPITYGTEDHPLSIAPSNNPVTRTLIGGEFHFKANLEAGRKYKAGTLGGTSENLLDLSVMADENVDDPDLKDYAPWTDDYNSGYIIIPTQKGTHLFKVTGNDASQFSFNLQVVSSRQPGEHVNSANVSDTLALTTLNPTEAGVSADCTPGRRNDPESGFYDNVIDEQLFKLPSLAKGGLYSFSTSGAATNIIMELYDAKGTRLARNTCGSTNGLDCLIAYRMPAAGDYYVGVCQALVDDEDEDEVPLYASCTITAKAVAANAGTLDSFDPQDDSWDAEPSALAPAIGTLADDVIACGSVHANHTLGLTDWVDTYSIGARKGLIYRLQSSTTNAAVAACLRLTASVYTFVNKKRTDVATIDNLADGGSFTASENATYYIEVSVAGGQGVDYGPYNMHSLACAQKGAALGMLTVNLSGATKAEGAYWTLASDKPAAPYYDGDSILLQEGSYSVKFATVNNWSAPATREVRVDPNAVTTVDAKYSDTYDVEGSDAKAGDGSISGKKVTTLSPSTKEGKVSRSLWSSDAADWYKFTVKPNSFYSFYLQPSSKLGDATITIYGANGKSVIAAGTSLEFLCREAGGTYYVCVSHATSAAEDSQYTMQYAMKQVGCVALGASSYSVKDSALSVSIPVNRTGGKDGRVRVRYATQAVTAIPGTHYVPQNGYLEWDDGNAKSTNVVITLIPDLVAHWEPDRSFKLLIAALDPSEFQAGDIAPMIGASEAVVTIQDATKQPAAPKPAEEGVVDLIDYAKRFTAADGMTVKSSKKGAWILDDAGILHSGEIQAGQKAEITLSLTGPGRFEFEPLFNKDEGDASSFTCTIGKEKAFDCETGVSVTRYVGAGTTTVKFTLSCAKDSVSAPVVSFMPQDDGEPFGWKALPKPELVSPLAGEVSVAAKCPNEEEMVTFMWKGADDPQIAYIFSLDADQNKLKKSAAGIKFSAADGILPAPEKSVLVYCRDCVSGDYNEGKQLASGKTYYWRVDSAFVENGEVMLVNTNSTIWTVTPLQCDGTPTAVIASGVDAMGREVSSLERNGTAYPVALAQGVPCEIALGGTNVASDAKASYALVKGSALPAGLQLKNGVISGIPSKAGEFTAIIQISQTRTVNKKNVTTAGGTVALAITVEPAGVSSGTFNGILETEDSRIADSGTALASMAIGSLTFTASDAGKLSAKVSVGGATYSFSAPSWGETVPLLENGLPGVAATLYAPPVTLTVNRAKVVCTNVLTVTACRAGVGDIEAATTPLSAEMTLYVLSPDKTELLTNVVWTGSAVRNNAKTKSVADAIAETFTGYYTVSLATDESVDYVNGYGYITLTVDKNGASAKVAGVLADGSTQISASSVPGYRQENANGVAEIAVPVYFGKGSVAFGGWLRLSPDDTGVVVVNSDSTLRWINTAATATYDGGEGFSMSLTPFGGYYNTLYNLQAYYLDYTFKVKDLAVDSLPEEIWGGRTPVAWPGMNEEVLQIAGNNITVSKQVKSMRSDDKKLVDWENTINPANLVFTFKQATGIYSGSFELWVGNADSGEETVQMKLGTFKHQGVLLMNRGDSAVSFEEAVMPGFYLAPVKLQDENNKPRTWNASLPFAIVPEELFNDWSEGFPE